jgi:DNA adenine methylase
MWQAALFDEDFSTKIVNVASVPQLSPFRYPGGKTWFVPYLRHWLDPVVRQKHVLSPIRPKRFIEPFLGGGSISLAVASEKLVSHIIMAEIDVDVAAVWQTVLDAENAGWLADKIATYSLTPENVADLLNTPPTTIGERAFRTIVKNRVNRGGILAPGAGQLKFGEDGRGILSRWYPATLARRIRHIVAFHDRLTFFSEDGFSLLTQHMNNPDAVFFIDPPYTAGKNGKRAGSRLYAHNELDHERLFTLTSQLKGDFLMTYDNSQEVRDLAAHHNLDTRLIPMKNTHHTKMMELLIGRNLDWLPLSHPDLKRVPGKASEP